jgi:hypothetical protein
MTDRKSRLTDEEIVPALEDSAEEAAAAPLPTDRYREGAAAMRRACARWHDRQALKADQAIRSSKHPDDAQRMQDRYKTHRRSAAAIRALPLPTPPEEKS